MCICVICICVCMCLLCVYFHVCVYMCLYICVCMYAHMHFYVFPHVWCVLVYVFNIGVWLNRSVYLSFFLVFFFLETFDCSKHLNREGRFPHSKSASVATHNLLVGAKLSMTESCTQYFARTLWSFSFGAKLLRCNGSWNTSSVLSWQNQGTLPGEVTISSMLPATPHWMDAAFAHFTCSQEVPEWAGTCTHVVIQREISLDSFLPIC